MARVFKHTYTTKDRNGGRVTKTAKKWYGEFTDLLRQVKRVPLCTDKRASRQALDALCEALSKAQAHATVKPDDLPPVIRKAFYAALKAAGHRDASIADSQRQLSEHLDEWHKSLSAKGNTQEHADKQFGRVRRAFKACRFAFRGDIAAGKFQAYLAELRQSGTGIQTCNYYLQAAKQFCNWMVREGRLAHNPLVHLQGGNAATDRRRIRRAHSAEELRRLIQTTRKGPVRYGMEGPRRALLYRMAAETGFRRKELRSLFSRSFDLDGEPPTVTVRAAYSKRRREDLLPIRPDLADELRPVVGKLAPDEQLFPVSADRRKAIAMLKQDLDDAGIPYCDDAGHYADFHALRHTFGTNLYRGDVHPKRAQDLMRHSTIDLTMNLYTHTSTEELASALDALPNLSDDLPERASTATPGETDPHERSDSLVDFLAGNLPERRSSPEPPQSPHGTEGSTHEEDGPFVKSVGEDTSDTACHPGTPDCITAEGGTRTLTPLRERDFESRASANSATSARFPYLNYRGLAFRRQSSQPSFLPDALLGHDGTQHR